jgi:hypothetical protein
MVYKFYRDPKNHSGKYRCSSFGEYGGKRRGEGGLLFLNVKKEDAVQ